MALIRKSIVVAQVATVFVAEKQPVLDESDLEFYLFNREARMNEAWEADRAEAKR